MSTHHPAQTYEFRSLIPTSMEQVIAFHNDPRALSILTPPPIFVQLHRRDWRSMNDATMEFTLWFGFIPIRWTAQHEMGLTLTSFVDRAVNSPVDSWVHEHIFEQRENGVELLDRLTIAHKRGLIGIFTRLMFGGLPLRFLFFYRHFRTKMSAKHYPTRQIA